MGSLPLSAALKSRLSGTSPGQYLSYNENNSSNMRFNGSHVVSPTTQFEFERSDTNSQQLHIRCCYSNKYIVLRSEFSSMLDAKAEEIEENTSLLSCTLFRFEFDSTANAYIFTHVQSGRYAGRLSGNNFRLLDNPVTNRNQILMDVIDWETLVILPPQVVFKGDNGRYLAVVRNTNSGSFNPPRTYALQFSRTDIADEGVRQEISYEPDGTINVKSLAFILESENVPASNRYWSFYNLALNNPLYISNLFRNHSFKIVKISENTIALRLSTTNLFCCRATSNNNFLMNNARSILKEAIFQLEEPVVSREIFNLKFRFDDARVYDQTPIVVMTALSTNRTDEPHWNSVFFRYSETRESTWRAFVSLNLGVKMKFKSGIPVIGRLSFEISANFNGEYEWGETQSETLEFTQEYSFPVPPMTEVTAYLLGTRGTCDIPFDYTVRDQLLDGSVVIRDIEGGVFTGVNNFNLHSEAKSVPLDSTKITHAKL